MFFSMKVSRVVLFKRATRSPTQSSDIPYAQFVPGSKIKGKLRRSDMDTPLVPGVRFWWVVRYLVRRGDIIL
jgi:hypothetical protein